MRPRVPWLTLVVSWLVVGAFLFVPRFQDDYLYNASPVLLFEFVSPFASQQLAPWLPWIALHFAITLAVTLVVHALRRRLTPAQFARAGAIVAGLLVGAAGWGIHECWPEGVFFDASTIHYDVGDLVGSQSGAPIRFESADDVVAAAYRGSEDRSEHYLPHYIGTPQGTQSFIAWGTWPEHYRLRKALEAMRAD